MNISGYEDLEEIGRGGYAVVYKGHQAQFGRPVAIKVLTNPGFGETDRARFEREALAMGRLSWHPNIVVVHETGTTDQGLPYLVEEFVEGGSLGEKLRSNGPCDPAEAVADVIQLCAAVHTAHEADLLHRDIKPDNALIDAFGRIKLADFGIAAVTGSTLTATGMVTATIAHAAPEVLNGARATFPADVYSLGSTLYELLAGTPAFVRDTDESIVPLVLRVTSDPVPDLRPQGVPDPIADAVESAMAKDPGDRPQTALAFGRELQAAQQALGLKVTDLAVRGGTAPPPRHDETLMGGVAVVPAAPAAPPTPTPPPPPAPTPPPPAPVVNPGVTSQEPVAAVVAAPTGTVAVPASNTPAPGQAYAARTAGPAPAKKKGSRLPVVLLGLLAVGLAVAAFLLLTREDDGGGPSGGDAAGEATDDGEATVASVSTSAARPFRIAATDDAVWVTGTQSTTVDRIDPATDTVVASVEIGGQPTGVDVNSAGVWVSDPTGNRVVRIDPATNQAVAFIDVEQGPRNVSATETSVWVPNAESNSVSRIDVANEAVQANIQVGDGPRGIVATDTDVWVTNAGDGTVTRIDASTNQVVGEPIPVGGSPISVVLSGGAVWVSEPDSDTVVEIDPATNEVVDTIPVGDDPGGMAATDTHIFVATSGDDHVTQIDTASGEITDVYETGSGPAGVSIVGTDLWVANSEADTVTRIDVG